MISVSCCVLTWVSYHSLREQDAAETQAVAAAFGSDDSMRVDGDNSAGSSDDVSFPLTHSMSLSTRRWRDNESKKVCGLSAVGVGQQCTSAFSEASHTIPPSTVSRLTTRGVSNVHKSVSRELDQSILCRS